MLGCLFFGLSSMAQTLSFYDLFQELSLPIHLINEKPDKELETTPLGTKSRTIQLENNQFFTKYTLYYDDLNELTTIEYDMKKSGTNKQFPILLEILQYNFPGPYRIGGGNKVSEKSFLFVKGNNLAELVMSSPRIGKTSLRLSQVNNVKLKTKYDEANKATRIFPINVAEAAISENGLDYNVSFMGKLENKELFLTITSDSKEWKLMKSIQISLSDGEVSEYNLTSKTDFDNSTSWKSTREVALTKIPNLFCEKMIKSEEVKIKINGSKETGTISLNQTQKSALQSIYKKIYD